MSDQLKILSISEISALIKNSLENRFQNLSLQGEITNYKVSSTGHHYFSLKDEKACIQCVLFKNRQQSAKFPFKNGDKVLSHGDLNVYEPSGTYQLVIKRMEMAGIGDLLAKIEALKQELFKLGYFDPKRKKPLPSFPKTIGIVTSLQGAVIQDIIHVLNRRAHAFHLIIYPVKVQGEGSAEEIKEALQTFEKEVNVDVIIIARGGGSIEDLMAYNSKIVADAIYHSSTPIISAVGHEVDYTICDSVADFRAPTPSAAAEIVMPATLEILGTLSSYQHRLIQKMQDRLSLIRKVIESKRKFFGKTQLDRQMSHLKLNIEFKNNALEQTIFHKIEALKQKKKDASERLKEKNPLLQQQRQKYNLSRMLPEVYKLLSKELLLKKTSLSKLKVALDQKIKQLQEIKQIQLSQKDRSIYLEPLLKSLAFRKERLKFSRDQCLALNPKMILKKGYCIPFQQNSRRVILSSKTLKNNEPFDVLFSDGLVATQVITIQEHYESKL